jgi:GNAT superfamily N-acetyltransferase
VTVANEEVLVGLEYLDAMTALLRRVRLADPDWGTYEAAELQWFWTTPRSTDSLGQLFWFDDSGRPLAAVAVLDFGDGMSLVYDAPTLVVVVMPDATPDWVRHVVERGLAHVAEAGIDSISVEVERNEHALRDALFAHGFTVTGEALIGCRLDAAARPAVSPLAEGYRLRTRRDTADRPHHMADARRPQFEERLAQTMHRPELDLTVIDSNDEPVAYGIFWYDSETSIGLVEPMRTHDEHQRRGLARHVLTAGVDLLAAAGAARININFEPDNPASGALYQSVGFRPAWRTDIFSRRA